MGNLRVALCQLDVTVGDLEGNADKVIGQLARAEAAGASLVVFPELVLTGYPPEDLLLEPGFVEGNLLALEKVAAATQHCAAIVGFVEEDGDLYNAAAVCAEGEVRAVVRKQLLPNYGVFDERRYFVPGTNRDQLFLIGGVRVGVTVCEDAWSPSGPVGRLGRGGRRARRDDQRVAVPCRHPRPTGAHARHARRRCVLRARLRQPRRRPGRARLRRRLHGLRPRRRARRVGSAVP